MNNSVCLINTYFKYLRTKSNVEVFEKEVLRIKPEITRLLVSKRIQALHQIHEIITSHLALIG